MDDSCDQLAAHEGVGVGEAGGGEDGQSGELEGEGEWGGEDGRKGRRYAEFKYKEPGRGYGGMKNDAHSHGNNGPANLRFKHS